jgi:hypothetical protein
MLGGCRWTGRRKARSEAQAQAAPSGDVQCIALPLGGRQRRERTEIFRYTGSRRVDGGRRGRDIARGVPSGRRAFAGRFHEHAAHAAEKYLIPRFVRLLAGNLRTVVERPIGRPQIPQDNLAILLDEFGVTAGYGGVVELDAVPDQAPDGQLLPDKLVARRTLLGK